MGLLIDLTGRRFERFIVIKRYLENDKQYDTFWLCKCDCGNERIVSSKSLRNGMTKSCGCLNKEMTIERSTTHGLTNCRLFRIWMNMKTRCYNPNYKQRKDYGGRGICICGEWLSAFKCFYEWSMAHGYSDELSIDRINNDGNYEPGNCRWATIMEQRHNQRNTKDYISSKKFYEYVGEEVEKC